MLVKGAPGVLCSIGYPSETHLELKSREVTFVHNLFITYPIVSTVCTEHGSDATVLFAKFQKEWTTETNVMGERDFARFEFKMSFGRISYIAQDPSSWLVSVATTTQGWTFCSRPSGVLHWLADHPITGGEKSKFESSRREFDKANLLVRSRFVWVS